jgi:hypothetical protein
MRLCALCSFDSVQFRVQPGESVSTFKDKFQVLSTPVKPDENDIKNAV